VTSILHPSGGAVGDLQVYADLEADAAMAAGLHAGSTASCVTTPSPPLPPAPPGGYSPPPLDVKPLDVV
jgi:hypothetical protein